jgi:hypothetical protein
MDIKLWEPTGCESGLSVYLKVYSEVISTEPEEATHHDHNPDRVPHGRPNRHRGAR